MNQQIGTITAIHIHIPETGFAIVDMERGGARFRAVGGFADPAIGKTYSIFGKFAQHDAFGFGFLVDAAVENDRELALANAGLGAIERRRVLATPDSESPFDVPELTLAQADQIADSIGHSAIQRAKGCALAILTRESIGSGIPASKLESAVREVTRATAFEAQQAFAVLEANSQAFHTHDGYIVRGDSVREARDLRDRLTIVASGRHGLDDSQLTMLQKNQAVSGDLTDSESAAVVQILNNPVTVLNIANDDRAALIQTSVAECLRIMEREPIDFIRYIPDEVSGPIVLVVDLNTHSRFAAQCRALLRCQIAVGAHVAPAFTEPLDIALDAIGNKGIGVQFTARLTDDGEVQGNADTLVHVPVMTPGELRLKIPAVWTDGALIVATARTGDYSAVALNDLLHDNASAALPVWGPFFPGEPVLIDGKIESVSATMEGNPADARLAYALGIDDIDARMADTTIVVVPPEGVQNWALYTALKSARLKAMIVCSDDNIRSLGRNRVVLPVDHAILDAMKKETV